MVVVVVDRVLEVELEVVTVALLVVLGAAVVLTHAAAVVFLEVGFLPPNISPKMFFPAVTIASPISLS